MMFPMQDLANHISVASAAAGDNAGAPSLVTAGGTGDNVKVTGNTINRVGTSGSLADGGVLAISWKTALTNTKTLSFAAEIQESADGTTWDTAEVLLAATVVKTAASTANFSGSYELAVDMSKRKQFVRFNVTPDLNNTTTDTAGWHANLIQGGFKVSKDAA